MLNEKWKGVLPLVSRSQNWESSKFQAGSVTVQAKKNIRNFYACKERDLHVEIHKFYEFPHLPKNNRLHPLNIQTFCFSLHQDSSYWNFSQNNHNFSMSKSENRWNEWKWFSSLDQKYVVCEERSSKCLFYYHIAIMYFLIFFLKK